EVVRELWVTRRLDAQASLSVDGGKTWMPITRVPGLGLAEQKRAEPDRLAADREKAKALRAEMEKKRGVAPHTIFGVARDAPIAEWRAAFFKLAKPYHADRVPPESAQEWKDACAMAFRFYSSALARVENGLS